MLYRHLIFVLCVAGLGGWSAAAWGQQSGDPYAGYRTGTAEDLARLSETPTHRPVRIIKALPIAAESGPAVLIPAKTRPVAAQRVAARAVTASVTTQADAQPAVAAQSYQSAQPIIIRPVGRAAAPPASTPSSSSTLYVRNDEQYTNTNTTNGYERTVYVYSPTYTTNYVAARPSYAYYPTSSYYPTRYYSNYYYPSYAYHRPYYYNSYGYCGTPYYSYPRYSLGYRYYGSNYSIGFGFGNSFRYGHHRHHGHHGGSFRVSTLNRRHSGVIAQGSFTGVAHGSRRR